MDQIPLVSEQIEVGRKLIAQLTEQGFPVVAAAWVKETDAFQWHLYLVTPLVGKDRSTSNAYARLVAVRQSGPQPPLVGPLQVKVVGPSEKVGRAIIDVRKPGGSPFGVYTGATLGNVSVDAAYIYPPAAVEAQDSIPGAR